MNRKHRGSYAEAGQASRSGVLVRQGRIIAMASVLAVAPMVTGFPQVSSTTQPHPVRSQIRQVAFVKSTVTAMRTAKDATGSFLSEPGVPDPISTARAVAVTPVQDVAGAVTVVGVTWPKGAISAKDNYQIRTLKGRTWSQWEPFDTDPADAPDSAEAANAIGGTSPYLVTGASKYEVRSLTTDPTRPHGANALSTARVQVVDPGTSSADSVQQAPGAASATTVKPVIYSRAAWGADESLRSASPSYGKILVGFVHHTVSSNSYTADQVPALIRGMYAYHVQSLGWSDIGYNFLIDRFGRTWEGRYGGMDRAVVGAQTLNFNSVSMGVSAIGNFDVAAVPQAMADAIKRILAWKFSLAGIPATGTVLANGLSLQRVSGHRDAFATVCPGQYLYAKLGEIRAGAAALIAAQKPVVPANRAPIGALDAAISTSPGVIAVRGWALDPDTTASIRVHVYLDGHAAASLAATGPRPDVGRIFGKGDSHGFTGTLNAAPGPHQVCLYAINTPAGPNPRIACKNAVVSNQAPIGALDFVTPGMDVFTVRGWALDPNTSPPINVHVYVDGVATASITANTPRPDVGRIYAMGNNHGFISTIKASYGPHQVCLYAIDSWGGVNPQIRCATVDVNATAIGALDTAIAPPGKITVRGWALDPNTTSSIRVHVYVDGRATAALLATGPRPDVGRIFGRGDNHGFAGTVNAAPGPRQVCIFAIDSTGGTNPRIGCKNVTVPR